jgi:hypothetical protein
METLNTMDKIVTGLAIVIFGAALFMLISGIWEARDK